MSIIIEKARTSENIEAYFSEKPLKFHEKWLAALKQVLPVYLAVHLAFFVITVYALLFTHGDFDPIHYPISQIWQDWNRWDARYFTHIAQHGNDSTMETAFFPLYPMLMKLLAHFTHYSEFIASFIVSNTALLVLCVVLYQLVKEDFDEQCAQRAVLYILIFPTAFFLATAYSEALYLCFAAMSFYQIRRGQWWLAGFFGFLASLTRPDGLFLVLPFAWEYFYRRQFQIKRTQGGVLAVLLIPCAVAIFALYCWYQFGNPLEFAVVQSAPGWDRHLNWPWTGFVLDIQLIASTGTILDYVSLRNLLDLVPDIFLLLPLLTGCQRLPGRLKSYAILGMILWLFVNRYPRIGSGADPLSSESRFMLGVFPAFVFLAILGKHQTVNTCYVMISCSVLFFMLTQFLTGHWIL